MRCKRSKRPKELENLDIVGLQDRNVHYVIMAWLVFLENLISNQQSLISMTKRFHICAKCKPKEPNEP